MLIAKGFDVGFELDDGRELDVSGAMLHDPDGESWPKCSLLIASFRRGGATKLEGEAKYYFGRGYKPHQGSVTLPPKDLDAWKKVGVVKMIFYERSGVRAPGSFKHAFGKRRWQTLFKKSALPVLYKLGRLHRLELGARCVVDDRGLVTP